MRVRKRRLWCDNATRARVTTRLAAQIVDALASEARSVTAVSARAGLSWRTAMRLVHATVTAVHDPDDVPVRRGGHR